MTPVISPWLFYGMEVADDLQFVGAIIAIMLFFVLVGVGIYLAMEGEYLHEDAFKKWVSNVKKLSFGFITCLVILVFVPSESTIIKMIVAQNVTYERVEVATDTVETVYNDIMALFEDSEGESE